MDVLNLFAHRYEHGMNNLNIYEIRQFLGQYFSAPIKRDAFEFLIALCTKYDYIKNLVNNIKLLLLVDANRVVIQKLLLIIISFFQFPLTI